jgi:carbamoyltransferase
MATNIIGISALYHDSACCVLVEGKLIGAAQEERFTRKKADFSIPVNAFRYCLEAADLSLPDIDCLAFYEDPKKKIERQLWSGIIDAPAKLNRLNRKSEIERQIRAKLGYEGIIKYYDHHASHAASGFYFSGFKEAAILTFDGVGEWATTTYGRGVENKIDIFDEVYFPDSLGLLYSSITSYLGFEVNGGEYKVMGLAPYGKPEFVEKMWELIENGADGAYSLNMKYFSFLKGERMYSEEMFDLFGRRSRQKGSEIEQFHKDMAKSLQIVLEDVLLSKAQYLHRITGMENLCMAGGVALNCVANSHILNRGPFKRLFVQPAANDAGGALGAAALAYTEISHGTAPIQKLTHVYLGPGYSSGEVRKLLNSASISFSDYETDTGTLLRRTAERIADGKVIGWCQGRMEFGPRSLGGRSILADPRDCGMRDRINSMVKMREGFRPFAPAVLDCMAKEHFDIDHESPYMLETFNVRSMLDLPAITHVDNSARVQTVSREHNEIFYDLLEEFYALTGCPILLNTSFNVNHEPIVCSPEDVVRCFVMTDIDCLVIGDYLIDKGENDFTTWRSLLLEQEGHERANTISNVVYTFI